MPSHHHSTSGNGEHRHSNSRHHSEENRQQLEDQARAIAQDNEKMALEILLLKRELTKMQLRIKSGFQENRKATWVGQIIIMAMVAIVITLLIKL